jgi:hypothetical protein
VNDDSAEWMAQLKASGQLRPVPHEGMEVIENERKRVEARVGVVTVPTNQGQQVLGTCSPGRWHSFKAALREFFNLHQPQLSHDEQQSVDEQTRVRTAWIRDNSRREQP